MMNDMEQATDKLVILMAKIGDEDALLEAGDRGLEIPGPVDTTPDRTLPTNVSPFGGDPIDGFTPRESLPAGILEKLAHGDKDPVAAAELHRRYPYLYDEGGHYIGKD